MRDSCASSRSARRQSPATERTAARRPDAQVAFNFAGGNADKRAMAQLSRPYQIALITVLGFAMAWFLVLHRSNGGGSSANSTPPAPAPVTHPSTAATVSPAHARAIRALHSPVAPTTKQSRSVAAPRRAHAKSAPSVSTVSHRPATSHTQTSTTSHSQGAVTRPAPSPTPQHANAVSPRAAQLEAELAQGKTVLLLFWNPKSLEDRAMQKQLQSAAHALGSKVVTHQASASEVDAFGALTQRVHVAQTPTILIINSHEQVSTLTGFTDSFVIRQAVAEAQNPQNPTG